jgi:hypothetical protein
MAPAVSLTAASTLLFRGLEGRPLYRDLRGAADAMSPLRRPAKAKAPRSLIAVSVRLVQRYARARRRTRATVQKPLQRRGELGPFAAR